MNRMTATMSEINLNNGDVVLVSYQTPVAARVAGEYFATNYKWSSTTSRHISRWLEGNIATKREQDFFYQLAA